MADAKIQIKLGVIEFSGEGEEKWVAAQLDKVLAQASDLLRLSLAVSAGIDKKGDGGGTLLPDTNVPLAEFLRSKSAGRNQVKRFLVTAIWLSGKGNKMLSTGDVTQTLKHNHQPKLTNPADCLNQNVGKGFCEKDGRQFFVTPGGLESVQ